MRTDPRCAECVKVEASLAAKAAGTRAATAAANDAGGKRLETERTPSVHLTQVHRAVHAAAGKTVFAPAREKLAEAGRLLERRAAQAIAGASDDLGRFGTAARWAAAATHLDPRAAGLGLELPSPSNLADEVERIAGSAPVVDDAAIAFELLRRARNVLFVHDGVGELLLDMLLIDEVLKHARRVYSAASGLPLGGRATADDLHKAGIADRVTEILPIGPGEVGVVWEDAAPELKGKLEVVDLIVSKGQANVYALHEREKEILKPMLHLFRTMCDPVAEVFGARGRVTVLKVWK